MPDGYVARPFDHKAPDYAAEFHRRTTTYARLRAEEAAWKAQPEAIRAKTLSPITWLKAHYKLHPAQFITDWGCTHDPRNIDVGLPALLPFVLFEKQVEWIDYVLRKWKAREPGLTEKSRDVGISWLAMGLACTLCLHHDGMRIGFGSRRADLVDLAGEPRALFYKGREFMRFLPPEFRGGWVMGRDDPYMRLKFPETGATIGGEAGDNIGRGDRTTIYFVDEAAHLEHPSQVDAALLMTTNCQIDMSSVNGLANSFAEKRHSGRVEVFIFDWRDDPRKDEAWYEKKKSESDPVIFAQEVDRDYSASVEGVVIPNAWARAAVDAHLKVGIKATGARTASLDVADEGRDKNAAAGAHGVLLDFLEEWSGKQGDIFATVERMFRICDDQRYTRFRYDADGLGAGVRGDARIINERRELKGIADRAHRIEVEGFRGSEAVVHPEQEDVKGRKNEDFFLNRKAQAWWSLRTRFQKTYNWVVNHVPCAPDEIISIDSKLPLRERLIAELSQPTYSINAVGKLVIDKAPDGTKSPNLADALMMQFSTPGRMVFAISAEALRRV